MGTPTKHKPDQAGQYYLAHMNKLGEMYRLEHNQQVRKHNRMMRRLFPHPLRNNQRVVYCPNCASCLGSDIDHLDRNGVEYEDNHG